MNDRLEIIGQKRVKKILASSLKRNLMAHAYFFHGLAGVGKDSMAVAMACGLVCKSQEVWGCGVCSCCRNLIHLDHPGFHLVPPTPSKPKGLKEEKYREILRERALHHMSNLYHGINYNPEISTLPIISIQQIRAIKQESMLKVAQGGYRIFLISQADRMTQQAANSLLKLLEEPPPRTLLILTTAFPGKLLPTIISRCQGIRFDPLAEDEIKTAIIQRIACSDEKAHLLAKMAGGSLQKAELYSDEGFENRRKIALGLLLSALDEDELQRITFVENLIQESDKIEIKEILYFLEVWIRDIFQLQMQCPENMMNSDHKHHLVEIVQLHTHFNAEEGLMHVARAIDFIEKNVYLSLILLGLSQALKRCNIK